MALFSLGVGLGFSLCLFLHCIVYSFRAILTVAEN